MVPKIGSCFSGLGGLDLAVESVTGGETVWQIDREPYCRRVLARHWPEADRSIVSVDDVEGASALELVDWIIGGYPCPGESIAGKGLGVDDVRWKWPEMREIIRAHRERGGARFIFGENVAAHVTRSFGHVLCDLAEMGYDACWQVVRADRACGAPHRRSRLFWLAWLGDAHDPGHPPSKNPGSTGEGDGRSAAGALSGQQPPGPGPSIGGETGLAHPGRSGWRAEEPGRPKKRGTASGRNGNEPSGGRGEREGLANSGRHIQRNEREAHIEAHDEGRHPGGDGSACILPGGKMARAAHPGSGRPSADDQEGSCHDLANAALPRGEARRRDRMGANNRPRGDARQPPSPGGEERGGGFGSSPQRGLGRVAGRARAWVESPRWPARPGEPQRPWESPRVVAKSDELFRRQRLTALGNIAMPAQAAAALRSLLRTRSVVLPDSAC